MADIIFPNTKATTSDAISSPEKEVVKDKPSLFDSLLKENLPEKEFIKKTDVKSDNNNEVINIKNPIVEEKEISEELAVKPQSSLLDRLVVEVKQDIKNSEELAVKPQSSLLDRLVVEVKQDIKNSEDVLNNVKNENVEIVKTDVKSDNNNEVINIKNPIVEEKEISEELAVKPQSSLLDRLVVEVKQDIKNSEDVLNNVKNENVEIVKTDVKIENNEKLTVETKIIEDSSAEKMVQVSDVAILNNVVEEQTVINKNILPLENIDKNNINNKDSIFENEVKIEKSKSLMDLLIQKNIEKSGILIVNENIETIEDPIPNKDLLSTMYLGNQRNIVNTQLLFNKNEAMQLLKDGSTVKDIEKSANLLDLGLDNVDIEQTLGNETLNIMKKYEIDLLGRKNILDKLMFEKNIKSDEIKNIITQSVEASKALVENTLNINEDVVVNVNAPISYNIQSRIIGAKQQMSTMMSDIARQMYENYKPPVTVFKLNLNPLELGSISILMKNDRNNALTISMNVSNATTLDALMDNQNILKSALNKTFDENTKFNLDFSSSNQNNNQSSNNGQNNQNGRSERQMDTQSILQLKEENKEVDEKILDYM